MEEITIADRIGMFIGCLIFIVALAAFFAVTIRKL
jgi:hypothetical protein